MYSPLLSFGISLSVLVFLTRGKLVGMALDRPNERSLHTNPVPRTGGIAILSGILAGWIVLGMTDWTILAGMSLLVCISFLDDLVSMPVVIRFGAHFLASSIFAGTLLLHSHGLTLTVACVIAVVWMINLYNFMDGSDGLAGGMALFGFGFYALAAWLTHDEDFALLNMAVAMSAGAFLFFNFHPARIFMGDSGSTLMGFLAAAFGLEGWKNGDWPIWFPLRVFSPFIVDSTATLLKRLLRKEKIWQAHKEHYYQRLIRMGLGHRNTALLEYALMAAAGASSILAIHHAGLLIAGWGLAFFLLMRHIDHRWSHFST